MYVDKKVLELTQIKSKELPTKASRLQQCKMPQTKVKFAALPHVDDCQPDG